jgi:ketosteroid isomerase-like protein
VVRASIDAFNRRDLPTLLERISPDVEWVPLRAVLEGDVYHGHEGIRRFLADMDEDIEDMRVRVDDVLEIGGSIVVYGAITGRGRGSHMDLDLEVGWLMRVRDERVDYLRAFTDREAARQAAEEANAGVEQALGPPARALDS